MSISLPLSPLAILTLNRERVSYTFEIIWHKIHLILNQWPHTLYDLIVQRLREIQTSRVRHGEDNDALIFLFCLVFLLISWMHIKEENEGDFLVSEILWYGSTMFIQADRLEFFLDIRLRPAAKIRDLTCVQLAVVRLCSTRPRFTMCYLKLSAVPDFRCDTISFCGHWCFSILPVH